MPSLCFEAMYRGKYPRYPNVVRGEVARQRCASGRIEIEAEMAVLQGWRVHGLAAAVHRNAHPWRKMPERVPTPVEPDQHASFGWLRVEKRHRSAFRSPARVDRQARQIAGGDQKTGDRHADRGGLQEAMLASECRRCRPLARVFVGAP